VQAAIFWLSGIGFFALQAAMLVYLLRARHSGTPGDETRRVEVVWTLVPAAVLAALVLMMSGLTQGSWSRVRGDTPPLASAAAPERGVLTAAR
jgi:heme/copper-type cytochrome/quinol oxidase subunit 2